MNANMNSLLIDCIFMYVNVMHLHLDVNVVVDMFLRGRDNSMNTKNCMTALWFANFFVGPQLALVVLKTSWYTVWFANKMSWLNWIIEFWLPNQPLLQHSCHLRVLGSLLQMRRVEIWSCLEYSQQVCAVPEKVLMKENRLTPVQGNPLLASGCLCLFVLEEAPVYSVHSMTLVFFFWRCVSLVPCHGRRVLWLIKYLLGCMKCQVKVLKQHLMNSMQNKSFTPFALRIPL